MKSVAGLALTCLALAGCSLVATAGATSGGGSPAGPASPAAISATGPITFATGKVDTGYLRPLITEWNQHHPAQKVTAIYLPDDADDQYAQLVANLQAHSTVYDVMSLDVIWTAEFASSGWITPISTRPFPLSHFLRPAVATATYQGHLYAVPFTSNATLLYYRRDILAAAGVKPPGTWTQLSRLARTIAPRFRLDGYGTQLQAYEGLTVNFAEAVQSAGGSLLSADGTAVTVNSPQATRALDFLVSGLREGWIPQAALGWNEEDSRRAFEAGKLLFLSNWPYVYGQASQPSPGNKIVGKFAVTALPGLRGPGSSTLGGANLAISAYAPHPATALAFIKFLTSMSSERQVLLRSALPPVWTSLYSQPSLVRRFPFLPVLKRAILTARPRPAIVNYNQFSLAISSAVHQALAQRQTVRATLTELAQELRQIIRSD
ncbi:MAG TPA: ABC transporter substrate-binding protein [Streptosporangiaceae bacterium]|nr:ABC transporter substrate-binding protein [Streptosporangiaceae bacterium]